jgi:hypothetical protein
LQGETIANEILNMIYNLVVCMLFVLAIEKFSTTYVSLPETIDAIKVFLLDQKVKSKHLVLAILVILNLFI